MSFCSWLFYELQLVRCKSNFTLILDRHGAIYISPRLYQSGEVVEIHIHFRTCIIVPYESIVIITVSFPLPHQEDTQPSPQDPNHPGAFESSPKAHQTTPS